MAAASTMASTSGEKPHSLKFLAATVRWRDRQWWGIAQAVGGFTDPCNAQGWRHHKPGRRAAWEDILVKTMGDE